VLYDGSCGACSRWVPGWQRTLKKHGLAVAPLQSPWLAERLAAAGEAPLQDFCVLLADGRQFRGADGYRQIFRLMRWTYPIFWLSCVPGFRWAFDHAYLWFARQRFAISRACGWRPGPG